MKKSYLYFAGLSTAMFVFALLAFSQSNKPESYSVEKKNSRVVFQLTTPDTAAYRALARQLNNLLEGLPKAQIEVVAHNKGISILHNEKSNVKSELEALQKRGVQFVACEQTMKQQKLEKKDILPFAGYVPRGLVELIDKQEKGWAYIKAGF